MSFFLQADALLAVFTAFLAAAVILSVGARNAEEAQRAISWAGKQSEADSLADFIAVQLADPEGNLVLKAVGKMSLEQTQVSVAGNLFGEFPPNNGSVFVSRRLVQVSGSPTLLEVRKW